MSGSKIDEKILNETYKTLLNGFILDDLKDFSLYSKIGLL